MGVCTHVRDRETERGGLLQNRIATILGKTDKTDTSILALCIYFPLQISWCLSPGGPSLSHTESGVRWRGAFEHRLCFATLETELAGDDPRTLHLNASFQTVPEKPTIKCDKADTAPCCEAAVDDLCLPAADAGETHLPLVCAAPRHSGPSPLLSDALHCPLRSHRVATSSLPPSLGAQDRRLDWWRATNFALLTLETFQLGNGGCSIFFPFEQMMSSLFSILTYSSFKD